MTRNQQALGDRAASELSGIEKLLKPLHIGRDVEGVLLQPVCVMIGVDIARAAVTDQDDECAFPFSRASFEPRSGTDRRN